MCLDEGLAEHEYFDQKEKLVFGIKPEDFDTMIDEKVYKFQKLMKSLNVKATTEFSHTSHQNLKSLETLMEDRVETTNELLQGKFENLNETFDTSRAQ